MIAIELPHLPGESGTIRLLRQDAEEAYCGIDRQPQVGTGCDGGPKDAEQRS